MEQWFLLRLTVTGYGVSHVLPGAVATTMTYRVLRRRGLDSEKVGLALAAVSVFIYGALGVIAGSLAYMLLMGNLGSVPTASSFLLLVLTLTGALFAYAAYRWQTLAKSVARSAVRLIQRYLPTIPLTPGGIVVFETTVLATLVLLGGGLRGRCTDPRISPFQLLAADTARRDLLPHPRVRSRKGDTTDLITLTGIHRWFFSRRMPEDANLRRGRCPILSLALAANP